MLISLVKHLTWFVIPIWLYEYKLIFPCIVTGGGSLIVQLSFAEC